MFLGPRLVFETLITKKEMQHAVTLTFIDKERMNEM